VKLNIESPTPGIYEGVPFEDYLKIDAVSNSYLSRLAITPAHAKVKEDDTKSKGLGRNGHTYVLEGPTEFAKIYKVVEKINKNTKVWKSMVKEAEEENRELVTEDVLEHLKGVRDAIISYPDIEICGSMVSMEELLSASVEQTIIWESPGGFLCKARPDIMIPKMGLLMDLKTTKGAGKADFTRAIINYSYNRQAVHYLRGVNSVSPYLFDKFKFICCELKKPYRVQVCHLDDALVSIAETELDELMAVEEECVANDLWPHYQRDFHSGGFDAEIECPLYYPTRG
jgi:hypothetical protein